MTKNEFQEFAKNKSTHELMVMFKISRHVVSFWLERFKKKPVGNIFPYPVDPKADRRKFERKIILAPVEDLKNPYLYAKILRYEFKEKHGIWPEKAK